jgi:hypothetical protein
MSSGLLAMKKCFKCGLEKPINLYPASKSAKSGIAGTCRQCRSLADKLRIEKDRDRHKARWSAYYAKNAERICARVSKYAADNPEKEREKVARKYASKLQRTIALQQKDRDAIKHIYSFAQWVSKKTGTLHHVDHIVPLKGASISGLHVPWNLRVIPASQNVRKSNKVLEELASPAFLGRKTQ